MIVRTARAKVGHCQAPMQCKNAPNPGAFCFVACGSYRETCSLRARTGVTRRCVNPIPSGLGSLLWPSALGETGFGTSKASDAWHEESCGTTTETSAVCALKRNRAALSPARTTMGDSTLGPKAFAVRRTSSGPSGRQDAKRTLTTFPSDHRPHFSARLKPVTEITYGGYSAPSRKSMAKFSSIALLSVPDDCHVHAA